MRLDMIDEREAVLVDIICNKQIKTVFQPIISLKNGSVLGHEALSRITCDSIIRNPEMLFQIAGEYNRLWELELLCRTKALEAAFKFMNPPYSKMLFINVNPNTMHDDKFKKGFTKECLMQFHIMPQNIIFEITERNVITDMEAFLLTIEHYRGQDYKIAIDDAGAGYCGLNLISDVNPNYIKLDMKLIRGIHEDNLKYALVKGMVELSKASNIFLIAEGIETYEELHTLIHLGVQYGQGYYIQRPEAEIYDIKETLLKEIKEINLNMNQKFSVNETKTWIKNLCSYTGVVSPGVTANYVYNIFKLNPDFFGLCIIEDEVPLGIVTYEKLALKMSGNYGFSLHQNKPISELMDQDFLSVDSKTPINMVCYLAMARSHDKLYDFIIVTENGRYIGTVTIKDLLQKTSEIEVENAKHLNPLTGLPGNVLIDQKINQCIRCNDDFSIAYIDIDNFKAYNDFYGFENGDIILKLLANILKSSIAEEHFIGHVGGDDFVVIMKGIYTEDYFEMIQQKFEQEVLAYYNPIDIKRGYITTVNRRGETEQFPIISLTIVVVDNQSQIFYDSCELTKLLASRKRIEKLKKLSLII